jgi:cytochrome c oxidase accessory protein FixG
VSTPSVPAADPQVPPPGRESVFQVAPESELLYSLGADGRRRHIHPRVVKGRFWHARRNLGYALIALFVALPLIPVGGAPAVFLDVAQRQFHILGSIFHPTDNLLLLAFGAGTIITVFFVGSIFGRLWCGFACPQNVYLEFIFRPIEIWLEGQRVAQRRLNEANWTWAKFGRKAAKWSLWGLIALAMALNFFAYFVSWSGMTAALADLGSHQALVGAVGVMTALIVFDLGWFRDQMCAIACPYGRLQNVLTDRDTVIPAYDARRGDPKGRPRKGEDRAAFGDCVNCTSCVQACPTGVDIRRGLQLECVASGQCMDACNAVMAREGLPPGLIRYTSERELETGERRFWRPRLFVYLALMALAWGALIAMLAGRGQALVEIVRSGHEPFHLNASGQVVNQQRLRLTNQQNEPQSFHIELVAPPGAKLVVSSSSSLTVEPAEVRTVNIATEVPPSLFTNGQVTGVYKVSSNHGFSRSYQFPLLGPNR